MAYDNGQKWFICKNAATNIRLGGGLRVPYTENALDKQIASTSLIHELTVVTRHHKDFVKTGVRVVNPFTE